MPDAQWLAERCFRYVGHWSPDQIKLQKDPKLLTPDSGIYAFVVRGRIKYIGKATRLRRRIRQYNRALAPGTPRKFRAVHHGLLGAWTDGTTIDVWIHYYDENCGRKLEMLEADWIAEKGPKWNG